MIDMPDEDAIAMGAKTARNYLAMIENAFDERTATAFAGAIAAGARNWIAERQGPRCAYELMQGLADDLVDQARAGQ